jgi:hypothetical protein
MPLLSTNAIENRGTQYSGVRVALAIAIAATIGTRGEMAVKALVPERIHVFLVFKKEGLRCHENGKTCMLEAGSWRG